MATKPRRPEKLYKIGEIVEFTDYSRQTVHNYTMLGLITEAKRTLSSHRLYGEDVFEKLEKIKQYKEEGKTLHEIKDILDKGDNNS
ncbi:MAG: hypothetical protein COA79_01030 [Planctomycetota bacterium]|nr:MAG: hypothetical protein COA79_01030 [Planctomycetota bacterium]